MRIGFLYSHLVWNVAYRAEGVAQALMDAGHDVTVVIRDGPTAFDAKPLHACDVVHIYRMSDEPVRRCAEDLQRRGIAVTWDNDDDVRLMPAEGERLLKTNAFKRQQEWQNQIKVARRADLVTTTSEHLAEAFAEAGATRVLRIENYLFGGQYRKPERDRRGGMLVGWVAAREHEACDRVLDVSGLLRDALERHPDLRVMTIGVRLAIDSDRYEHQLQVPLRELNDHVCRFDVALAPLADVPMSASRSNVKVKEYAAAGVPWLASARGPYLGLGAKEGGMLVADDAWPQALDALLGSRMKRARLARRAASWAKTQSIDRNLDVWTGAFEQAMRLAGERAATTRAQRAS